MSRVIIKRIINPLYSSSSRHLLKSQIPKPNPSFSVLPTISTPNFRSFCSSEGKTDEEVIIPPNLEKLFPGIKYCDNEEFDKMVEEYRNGNTKLVSKLLRVILARKVSGRHDGADAEIMEEISEHLKQKEEEEDNDFYDWRRDSGLGGYKSQEALGGKQSTVTPGFKIDMKGFES
ncbi:uncharacterized protein LOC113321329 isoform X2 [Papaver somniferum]|uniref:uncharacterized protein LOC113321329 isoform X2 n=1 Tax=Papaver somniferum TaxID=3469 RepID=UPI000E6FC8D3|nr:uncharacterized protein LOC113321329 isoform X2 [Papaver somniferum]